MESDLYPPIKRYLERLGLEVKGEVCGCDLVALSDGSPELVVIGEMKQSFTLELVLQAVDRTSACDEVWLAVSASKRGRGRENDARVKKLCRFLGFGLLAVTAGGRVVAMTASSTWVGFKHEVMSDQNAGREARPNGNGRLNVQGASDHLLADLAKSLRRALTKGLYKRVLVVVGAGFGPDTEKRCQDRRLEQHAPVIVDLVFKAGVAFGIRAGLTLEDDRAPVRHDQAIPDQEGA